MIGSLLALVLGVLLAFGPAAMAVAATPSSGSEPLPQLFDRALRASRDGRFGDALPLWDQVIARAPEDAAAWSNRGNVQLALGDPEAAIADQGRAMQLDPENPDPHLNRGTAEEALGQWAAAEADYRWILEANASAGEAPDASALYNLGNVQGSRGNWAAARASFVEAADVRPGFAMARSSGALANGALEGTSVIFSTACSTHPAFPTAYTHTYTYCC